MSRERTDDEVKRLAPKQEVLRELYIKSGNECAYPGCHNVLVDEMVILLERYAILRQQCLVENDLILI